MTENIHQELAASFRKTGMELDCLNDWSADFLADLEGKDGFLSKKQWECLARIAATVQDEERVARRVARRAAQ